MSNQSFHNEQPVIPTYLGDEVGQKVLLPKELAGNDGLDAFHYFLHAKISKIESKVEI